MMGRCIVLRRSKVYFSIIVRFSFEFFGQTWPMTMSKVIPRCIQDC